MASSSKSTKVCILCSCRTIEKSQSSSSNSVCYQQINTGLECSLCHQMVCSNCVNELSSHFKLREADIHPEFMDYINQIHQFSTTGYSLTYNNYVGHCCLLHIKCENKRNLKRKQMSSSPIPMSFNIPKFGGSFCLPEYNLLIANDTTCMDVFSLARETNISPSMHFVVDEEYAKAMIDQGNYPTTEMPSS